MKLYADLDVLEDITNNALIKISRKNAQPEIVELVDLCSLADHDNQIRKQVCEEFREIVRQKYPICYINMREKLFNSDEITISFKKVSEILDQIKEKK